MPERTTALQDPTLALTDEVASSEDFKNITSTGPVNMLGPQVEDAISTADMSQAVEADADIQTQGAVTGAEADSSAPGRDDPPTLGTPYEELAEERAASGDPEFAKYEATADSAEVAKASTFQTPESTVQGQLASIMEKEGPLQKLAASKAKERASALGMSSSSAGMGAVYRAQLESAMPMAQQDAATAADFQKQEQLAVNEKRRIDQEAQVSGDLTLQKAKINEKQKKIDDEFALKMKGLDADTEKAMIDIKGGWDKKIQDDQQAFQTSLQDSDLSAQAEMLLSNQVSEAVTNAQVSMQNLMGDSEFLDDMAAADEALIAQKIKEGWTEQAANKEFGGSSIKAYMNKIMNTATSGIKMSAKAAGLWTPAFRADLDNLIAETGW